MLLKIAFRNVFRQKRRTILTALTICGGFILAALSIGLTDGTYAEVIDLFTRNRLGHIQIHADDYLDKPSLYKNIENVTAVGEKIQSLSFIDAWSPRLYSAGLASVGDKSAGVQIIGIDLEREVIATRFDKKVIKGKVFSQNASPEAIMGKGLAKVLHADVGDEVVIVSQAADGSIANALYHLAGIVDSGDELSDRMAFYLPLAEAQELLALPDRVHEIVVIADDLDHVDELTLAINAALSDASLAVEPWQVFARSFYEAMQLDQQGNWISLFIILLIVAIGVLNTVLMSVLERTREYGVLKAVGTQPAQIFKLVVYEVNFITVASVVVGAALSLLLNYVLSRRGIALPETFTFGGVEFKEMYSEVNLRSLLIPAITVLVAANVISLFPSLKAAHTEPARAMRMH
jgi:ABC-type lipoprotein release transport system permease subunit